MEFLNKVELKGVVGSVNHQQFGLHPATRFQVVVNTTHNEKNGDILVETLWLNCIANSQTTPACRLLEKGDKVHVCGRLKANTYTDHNNEPRLLYEVVVGQFEILSE